MQSLRWEESENKTEDGKSPQHSKETKTFLRGTGKKHTLRSFLLGYTPEEHTGFAATQKTLNLSGRSRHRRQDRGKVIYKPFWFSYLFFYSKVNY